MQTQTSRVVPKPAPLTRDAVLAVVSLASLLGLTVLALAFDPTRPGAADLDVALASQDIHFPGWGAFIDVSEFLSRPIVVALIGFGVAVGFTTLRRWLEAGLIIAAMLVRAPKLAINELISRERPTEATLEILRGADGFAFPSGYTTGAVVV